MGKLAREHRGSKHLFFPSLGSLLRTLWLFKVFSKECMVIKCQSSSSPGGESSLTVLFRLIHTVRPLWKLMQVKLPWVSLSCER